MGILSSLRSADASTGETREKVNPAHPRDPVLAQLFGDPDGTNVTPDSAMRVTAVYACVALIAETLAALPLHVYRRDSSDAGVVSTSKATEHPLYGLLHDMPVSGMTSFEWREMQISHTALRGDSFARIVLGADGRVRSLPPILPPHIEPFRHSDGSVRYRWWPDGTGPMRILFDDEVLRVPHKLMDGVHSLSPIATHRLTIGNAMSATRFLKAFYQNSAQPKGALMSEQPLDDDAAKALRKSWEERHMGPHNAGRVAIFDGGLKWESIGMTMDEAQYLDLQKFSVSDIARIYLVPPHKVGEMGAATFSNIEHQAIEFVVDTILRWVRRHEMRYNSYLLSRTDRAAGYYIAFDMKGLLRGDAAARAAFYRNLFYIGAMTPNEVRAAEDMNPYDGGNEHYVQGATVPIGALGPDGSGAPGSIDDALQSMIDAALQTALEKLDQGGLSSGE
ncbi:phage portal protein [uncultured Roseobacter sp.]|uniref:phage portal protein n=1 Tax=uncultured Roseobacter sp. TaxID=114847 RepID=UPI00262B37C0|nr:phage portal protein [uncultured Roseobacter sp.]